MKAQNGRFLLLFRRKTWKLPRNLVTLWSKTTKLGGASAIKARFIALGLHEPCSQKLKDLVT
jgi:hypothetical protein